MVGAVVVLKGHVVGQGYHQKAGGGHAEIVALERAGHRARGATLYVTLEPCCHTKKRTPPCVPAILESGIAHVVVAMRDPNPKVRGKGVAQLRRAGLTVTEGVLASEAAHLNEAYCHWVTTGRPFVILKSAMTLDGKTATSTGDSKWISGPAARRSVHLLRSQVDAIVVGRGTVEKDNPQLTARPEEFGASRQLVHQPLRVVLDSRLRLSPASRVCVPGIGALVVAVTDRAPVATVRAFEARGIRILRLPDLGGRVSLRACLRALGRMGVTSVLVEGGSAVNAALFSAKLVNRVMLFISPRLLGGDDAKGLIGGPGPSLIAQAFSLTQLSISQVENDLLIEGIPNYS
jgi:diaminohydroxyphosphoribosylaminopyrimidine deaminase/5-amino-6-(5-phosphoribosylamino)uracil reductase